MNTAHELDNDLPDVSDINTDNMEHDDDDDDVPAAAPVPTGPTFASLGLSPLLRAAIEKKGFLTPTTVQAAVLAPAVATRDLLVSSRTGSGKTIAFGMAAARTLAADDKPLKSTTLRGAPRLLVIAPTRELALQVEREIAWLYAGLRARVTSCVGGTDSQRERRTLAAGVHIVVGTPGRLVDHFERKALDLSAVDVVVLDEADEMLDMGFQEDLETLLDACSNPARRTLLFSATLPPPIVSLARKYQKDAVRIQATPTTTAHQDIAVLMHPVAPRDREHAVVNVLRFHDAQTALVFVAMRETVTRLHGSLLERGFSVVALSGELSQAERNRALQSVRDGRARVLVCTDVAARGLDLPEVSLIIHADVAENSTALTHRNGRTGRAGKKGTAVVLATGQSRFSAERQLFSLGLKPHWTPVPSAESIHARDRQRLIERLGTPNNGVVGESLETEGDVDDALVQLLIERFSPHELARLVARQEQSRLPAPEDVADSIALAARATRQEHPRSPPKPFVDRPHGGGGPPRRGPPKYRR